MSQQKIVSNRVIVQFTKYTYIFMKNKINIIVKDRRLMSNSSLFYRLGHDIYSIQIHKKLIAM